MNPTRPTFDLNRRRVNRLAWLAAHTVPSLALLVLTMAGGSFAPAQDTNAPVQANDALQPGEMVPANDNGQSDDETSGDDMVETNSVAQTNGTAPGGCGGKGRIVTEIMASPIPMGRPGEPMPRPLRWIIRPSG